MWRARGREGRTGIMICSETRIDRNDFPLARPAYNLLRLGRHFTSSCAISTTNRISIFGTVSISVRRSTGGNGSTVDRRTRRVRRRSRGGDDFGIGERVENKSEFRRFNLCQICVHSSSRQLPSAAEEGMGELTF